MELGATGLTETAARVPASGRPTLPAGGPGSESLSSPGSCALRLRYSGVLAFSTGSWAPPGAAVTEDSACHAWTFSRGLRAPGAVGGRPPG